MYAWYTNVQGQDQAVHCYDTRPRDAMELHTFDMLSGLDYVDGLDT